ncbi:MAG: AmmeMemoRadiSam system radical SAM enzyme, partial [Thermodesulfovibrionales bacterium]|nr:AmmeMemoRadiSam system radical SAM enzyme [Thermodesulfovibrionales bacterium]
CKFCQNWQISQARPEDTDFIELPPAEVIRQAARTGCRSVCYTYTEPTVFYEYMLDTAALSHGYGIKNTAHTCGYIKEKPLRELSKHLDAADVDLKAFTEDFYGRICGGRLKPVLDAIVTLKEEGVWLELTNLVIPTLNDNMQEIRQMCKWIVKNAGPDVPLHLSRFFPYYKLKDLPPTPVTTLKEARATAMDAGLRYVYIGNLQGEAENTYCHNCKKPVIERMGYFVARNRIKNGRCVFCGTSIPGVWA